MPPLQLYLTIIALSLWLIVFLALSCVVFTLVSMWKENRFGWPLRGVIWFTIAIAGSCAVIALLAGYLQKAKSSKNVSNQMEAVTAGGFFAAMSGRDLLTFNLFLQFTDGFVSYQAFALGEAEANLVVAAAIVNWGVV